METLIGSLTYRVMMLKKGEIVPRHQHYFGHPTEVRQGKAKVTFWKKLAELDDKGKPLYQYLSEQIMDANLKHYDEHSYKPAIFCEAHIEHEFEALEDYTIICCVMPPRDPITGFIVEHDNGWRKAAT